MKQPCVQIAFDLMPLRKLLYKEGILWFDVIEDAVQMTAELFKATFPEHGPAINRGTESYPWMFSEYVTADGRTVKFFCVSESEEL